MNWDFSLYVADTYSPYQTKTEFLFSCPNEKPFSLQKRDRVVRTQHKRTIIIRHQNFVMLLCPSGHGCVNITIPNWKWTDPIEWQQQQQPKKNQINKNPWRVDKMLFYDAKRPKKKKKLIIDDWTHIMNGPIHMENKQCPSPLTYLYCWSVIIIHTKYHHCLSFRFSKMIDC